MAGRGKGGAGAGPSGSSQTQSQSFLPGKTRQKYIRDVCQTPIISYDLKNHYKLKTNWEQLKKLQMGEDESNVEELEDIEAHTYCMYKNGYTESKLPGSTLDPGSIHPENSKFLVPYIVPEVC